MVRPVTQIARVLIQAPHCLHDRQCNVPCTMFPHFPPVAMFRCSVPLIRYIVHAWDAPFRETVEALLEELTPPPVNPGLLTQPNLRIGVMLWIGVEYSDTPRFPSDLMLVFPYTGERRHHCHGSDLCP